MCSAVVVPGCGKQPHSVCVVCFRALAPSPAAEAHQSWSLCSTSTAFILTEPWPPRGILIWWVSQSLTPFHEVILQLRFYSLSVDSMVVCYTWDVDSIWSFQWKRDIHVSSSSNNWGLGVEVGLANVHKHLAGTVTAVPVNTICLISVKTLPYFPFKV